MRVTNGARYIVLEQKLNEKLTIRSVLRLDRAAIFQQTEKKRGKCHAADERLARVGTKSIFVGSDNPDAFRQECACGIPHALRSSDPNEPLRVNGA